MLYCMDSRASTGSLYCIYSRYDISILYILAITHVQVYQIKAGFLSGAISESQIFKFLELLNSSKLDRIARLRI
jgi:hypothetical protein